MAEGKRGNGNPYPDDTIVSWLQEWASGVESLSSFFSAQGGRIAFQNLYIKMANNETIREEYARAIETRAERYNADIDDVVREIRTGQLDPASARVILDARKWQASKMAPKKYGDKIQTELSGKVETVITGMKIT